MVEAHRRGLRAGADRRGPRRRPGGSGRGRSRARCATIDVFAHFAAAAGLAGRGRRRRDERDPRREQPPSSSTRARGTGLPIRVLSREEEARYGYLAAVNSTTLADGAVLDLGGGSLQLVARGRPPPGELGLLAARRGAHDASASCPATARPSASSSALREHVADELAARAVARRRRAAARRHRRHGAQPRRGRPARAGLPEFGVQGFVLDARGARRARRAPGRSCRPPSARASPGIKPARGRPHPRRRGRRAGGAGASAASTALEATEAGLREGVFFERLLAPSRAAAVRRRPPRERANLAAQYGFDPAPRTSTTSPALALGLFDELARRGPARRRPARARAAVGGVHCCTTSAWRSTTTTTTSTRAT